VRLIQLPALGVSGAFGFAAGGARAGAFAGALAAGAFEGAFAGALAADVLAACGLGAAVRAVVVCLGVEPPVRTGAGTGFFLAGPLAAGAAGIGFFMGALADMVGFVLCWMALWVMMILVCFPSEEQ